MKVYFSITPPEIKQRILCDGVYNPETKTCVIDSNISILSKITTISHELAHYFTDVLSENPNFYDKISFIIDTVQEIVNYKNLRGKNHANNRCYT